MTALKLSNANLLNDNPNIEDYIKQTDETLNSAVSAIRHMVLIEKLQTNLLRAHKNKTDIAKVAYSVIDRKRFQWDVNLRLHGARSLHSTDQLLVEAVISELIDNSCRYKSKNVNVSVANNRSKTQITVEDDGEGIEVSELPHVFDAYYRIEKHRVRSRRAGLGLTAVKTITNRLDGDIKLYSHPDWGTKTIVTLN